MLVDLSPSVGDEQSGRRRVLVLTPESRNRVTGLAVACPIADEETGSEFEVPFPASLMIDGVVLADQARTLDWRHRNVQFLTRVPMELVDRVALRIGSLLGIPLA